MKKLITILLLILICFFLEQRFILKIVEPFELWKVTFYCSCKKCTGKDPGHPEYNITASNKSARAGYCAVNWLPFGTKLNIKGLGVYQVEDRGAQKYFGNKKNHIKAVDIWVKDHATAKNLGVQYKWVKY
jgi:hypothetical protein